MAEDTNSGLATALQSLPLLGDDQYLRMQALNIGVVSQILYDMEHQLLIEYIEQDRTPPTAVVVSAISQLWIFGIYELLRTWRQRTNEVLKFGLSSTELSEIAREQQIAARVEKVRNDSADPAFANPAITRAFEIAARDQTFREALRVALDRSEVPFRRLEALRIHLAKHEVPKTKPRVYGMTPGYGRMDESNGSLFWEVPLGEMEVDHISRQSLAETCERFPSDESILILPEAVQARIRGLPRIGYGVKHVKFVLDDSTECEAFVGWDRQILKVVGQPPECVDPNRIVDVEAAQESE
jgi:hypothetical protein